MSIPRSSLRAFLSSAKTALRTAIANKQRVNFVVGNESADLDSITSAIVYAYFREPLHIPIVNIPRADVDIRPELLALLPHANIERSHLITLDDLPSPSALPPENTRWVLVDHNVLLGPLSETYADRVVGCIDHHEDEQAVPDPPEKGEQRVVQKCGSCTSLVVRHSREKWDALSGGATHAGASSGQSDVSVPGDDAAVRATWDAQLAKFAIASVLVDTQGLTNERKVTDDDIKAAEYLESKIRKAPRIGHGFDKTEYYNEINGAKDDIGRLTVDQIMRKDYKQWTERGKKLGISTTNKSIMWTAAQAKEKDGKDLVSAFEKFAKERDLAVYSLMTAFTGSSNQFQRELLVSAIDSSASPILERFKEDSSDELGLKPWNDGSIGSTNENTFTWHQTSLDKSRKQVAPLLRQAMNKA